MNNLDSGERGEMTDYNNGKNLGKLLRQRRALKLLSLREMTAISGVASS